MLLRFIVDIKTQTSELFLYEYLTCLRNVSCAPILQVH